MKIHHLFLALLIFGLPSTSGDEDPYEVTSILDCKNQTICNSQDKTGNCSNVQIGVCVLHVRRHAKQLTMEKQNVTKTGSLGSGRWTKRKWSRRSQLQDAASTALRRALLSERARSWRKVVEYYTELLDILNQVEVYQISDPDVSLAQLLYESHFHLAVALQNLNLHRKAIQQLENAAAIASIPKNGCNVGCKYETFFHTPIFSRMAYSHAACGQMKEAIKDANKAISLDNLNPDVYCVRALVWNSCKETKRAIYDLNCGLRLNPSHICTLILRGAITKSIANENEQCDENKDHEKVCKICPTNKRFLDVTDFSSPKMADFYDKKWIVWEIPGLSMVFSETP